MNLKKIVHTILYLAAVGISIAVLFFVIACTWIGYEVKSQCQQAKNRYGGDCVTALTTTVQDEGLSFAMRNDAVWSLGQLGDQRALPILQSYYTGQIPDREPLNQTLSQYELKKAINLTSGGYNATAIFWRYGKFD